MKQAIIMIVLAVLTLPTIGQTYSTDKEGHYLTHRIFVNELSQEFDGYASKTEDKRSDKITFRMTDISIPSFYDNELVITIINRWVRGYSDIKQSGSWARSTGGGVQAVYDGAGSLVFITFLNKTISIATVIEDTNVYEK